MMVKKRVGEGKDFHSAEESRKSYFGMISSEITEVILNKPSLRGVVPRAWLENAMLVVRQKNQVRCVFHHVLEAWTWADTHLPSFHSQLEEGSVQTLWSSKRKWSTYMLRDPLQKNKNEFEIQN